MFYRPAAKRCRAHRHDGGVCRNWAVRGKNVCRLHGGLSPGRQGPRDAEHMRKLRSGSQRWYAFRQARKAGGLPIRRMGRIPGRRNWEPIEVSRARASAKDEMKAILDNTKRDGEIATFDAAEVAAGPGEGVRPAD